MAQWREAFARLRLSVLHEEEFTSDVFRVLRFRNVLYVLDRSP